MPIVFAEDTGQLAKLTDHRAEPPLTKVVLFDGPGDGDWVITLAGLAELGQKYLLEHPSGCAGTYRRDHPAAVGDVDLHLRNNRIS